MKNVVALLVILLISLTSCRTIPEEAKIELAKPVDCATAEQDIALLEREKASVAKRFASGVTAVVPAGAVLSIITHQEKDKLQVAVGEYNHKLHEKIREIKTTCELD